MEMAMELRLVLQETLTACLVAAEAATVDGSEQRSDICDRGSGPQSEKKAKMARWLWHDRSCQGTTDADTLSEALHLVLQETLTPCPAATDTATVDGSE